MRRVLYIVNWVLALLFLGGALTLTLAPEVAERQLRAELTARVEREAVARYPQLAAVPALGGLAGSLYEKAKRLPGVAQAAAPVERWLRERYEALVAELLLDLKIFALTNAVCFGLACAAVRRESAGRRSLVLSGILMVSASLAAATYLFRQDWLHTILLSSYYGYGYTAFVAAVAGALCDLVFNRGRVLSAIAEGLTNALGSLASST